MVTKEKAFGPHPLKSYTYRELPIGATSIGIHDDTMKTGSWRTAVRPVLKVKTSPCNEACPAGVDVRGFISLMKQGLFLEAHKLYLEENQFPALCGRVCYHPCEDACNRKDFDQAVGINALERFLADFDTPILKVCSASGRRVAVVGSGPAGMSCSSYLARLGHHVTIFESQEVIGGLLRTGIPDYRLPIEVVEKEVRKLQSLGIEFKTKHHVNGKTWRDLEAFDAILLGYGASEQLPPPLVSVSGPDQRVLSGLGFLKDVKFGKGVSLGRRVVVIGGGNTAIDAARVSLRLGASPTILYRRSKAEMPAFKTEIEDAIEEGVQILFLTSPVGLEKRKSGLKIKCIKNRLAEVDGSGRPRPSPIEGSDFFVEADSIISATGEASDFSFLPGKIEISNQSVNVNELGLTSMPGVFACGDVTSQPRTVVHAIGSGKKAAIAIDCYLRHRSDEGLRSSLRIGEKGNVSFKRYLGDTSSVDTQTVVRFEDLNLDYFLYEERHEKPKLPQDCRTSKKEVYGNLSTEQALREAERCFSCGMCDQCDNCFLFCPDSSVVKQAEGRINIIDLEYCKGCGICANECPIGVMKMEKEE
jgi:NADPH-dependent glutamate synthase beta subunit-like oxidoreductase